MAGKLPMTITEANLRRGLGAPLESDGWILTVDLESPPAPNRKRPVKHTIDMPPEVADLIAAHVCAAIARQMA